MSQNRLLLKRIDLLFQIDFLFEIPDVKIKVVDDNIVNSIRILGIVSILSYVRNNDMGCCVVTFSSSRKPVKTGDSIESDLTSAFESL